MSSSSDSSPSSVDDASERERQEAEEDFRQMCARAIVRLCTRHHDLLKTKAHSQRSASGHLASRCANLPWAEVRDRVLDLLPVALQNTLRSEIDLMGENWNIPLLPNDSFIIRKSPAEDLPEPEEAANHAMTLLRGFLSQRTDDYERIMDVGFKLPKYTRVSIWMEFFVRSMPVDQRILYLNWLGEKKMAKRRKQE